MAETEQPNEIKFWTSEEGNLNTPPISNGNILITRIKGTTIANLYLDWGETRYKLKPTYSWEDIEGLINPKTVEDRLISLEELVRHFAIFREYKEDSDEEILHIFSGQDGDIGEMEDDNGNPLTVRKLKELITDGSEDNPGTFNVEDKPIKISDFTPSEELVGYITIPTVEGDNNGE